MTTARYLAADPIAQDHARLLAYDAGERDALEGSPASSDLDLVAPDVAEAYREGYESVRLITPDPARAGVLAPAEHRAAALADDAAAVLAFLETVGVPFDARAAVAAAAEYTADRGGASLAFSADLDNTAPFARFARRVAEGSGPGTFIPARLRRATDEGRTVAVVYVETVPGKPYSARPVGTLADGPGAWIADAVAGVRVYVEVGRSGAPLTLALTGVADAVRECYDGPAEDAAHEGAYGSGSRAAIEALTD